MTFFTAVNSQEKYNMEKLLSTQELYSLNTIAVKTEAQKRNYSQIIGDKFIEKDIVRTKYLKLCWMCGNVYESYKRSSYACQPRCTQNIIRYRKSGLNPPSNMQELTKPKSIKAIKEQFGYR